MSASPQETSPRNSLIDIIDAQFKVAYDRSMNWGENTIVMQQSICGAKEVIALEPKALSPDKDNVCYIVSQGGLSFGNIIVGSGEDEVNIKYTVRKIIRSAEDNRHIADMGVEDIRLTSIYLIGDGGEVLTSTEWLDESEKEELATSIGDCVVAPCAPV